jgi:glucose/arabinose dehydrogenase/PKD repeat protein
VLRSTAVLLALLASLACASAAPAGAVTFTDPGFEAVTLAGGLTQPTAVAYAPDGRMFIALKQGGVRVVTAGGHLLSRPILDVGPHTTTSGDRGLLGLALSNTFASDGIMYLLYSYGSASVAKPDPTTARLTRVTVHPDNSVDGVSGNDLEPDETVILGELHPSSCGAPDNTADCIPSDSYTHSIGTVRVDPNDGTLWVGAGDAVDDDAAHIEALQAQDENSLAGKILHVGANGQGILGHSFCPGDADLTHNCTKVWAKGFRNPFRFTLRQVGGVSRPVAGDVGWGHWEELTDVSMGSNGGWPCWEADEQPGPYKDISSTCNSSPPTPTLPFYQYSHFADECSYPSPPDPCDTDNHGGAVVGGPAFTGTWGAAYSGRVFFTDYVHGFLHSALPGATQTAAPGQAAVFATGLGHAVFLDQIPAGQPEAGNLVYVVIGDDTLTDGSGSVVEIRKVANGNLAPIPRATADKSCGAPGVQVAFDGSTSSDPESQPLTYLWDFGDGSTSAAVSPSHTYPSDGDYVAQLTVTDSEGASQSAFIAVSVHAGANPVPGHIVSPSDGDLYLAGNPLTLSGSVDTPMTGLIQRWQVFLNHSGSHVHVLADVDVTDSGGDYVVPAPAENTHGAGSFLILRYSINNQGCVTSYERQMQFRTGSYRMRAQDQLGNPVPAPLTFTHTGEDETAPSPHDLTVVKRGHATVSAKDHFVSGGFTYDFASWSDGGARLHNVIPFDADPNLGSETITATYTRSDAAPTASIQSPPNGGRYVSGEPVTLTGSASDAEDGSVAPSGLRWQLTRHSGGSDTALPQLSGASPTFTPDTGSDNAASYSVRLVATDAGGAASQPADITLYPTPSGQVTLASSPAGASLSFNGEAASAPTGHLLVSGRQATIGAPAQLTSSGKVFMFASWSDGGALSHTITGDGSDRTLTATYVRDGAPPVLELNKPARRPASLSGTVADPGGVASVTVGLRLSKKPKKGCAWWSPKRRKLVRTKRSCRTTVAYRAKLSGPAAARAWRIALGRKLPKGRYVVVVVAKDANGNRATTSRSLRSR